jgi:hypothetical protein
MQVRIWEKLGVTGPHLASMAGPAAAAGPAGAAEPPGAVGLAGVTVPPSKADPAPHHVSSPSNHHFHKHTLDGWYVPGLCQFDPKE